MAGIVPKGKQLSASFKPSLLRNETRPRPSGEETASETGTIQVPDSQVVIPETQAEGNETDDAISREPLSPATAAILDHHVVKKKLGTEESSAFHIKLLSKETFMGDNSFPPASSAGFSFGQPKRVASRPSNTDELSKSQPIVPTCPIERPNAAGKC
jgi:hypothetical protein